MNKFKNRRTSERRETNETKLLRELRIKCDFSIREVARRIEKSETYLRHIENGRLNFPSDYNLKLILEEYGVTYRQYKQKLLKYTDSIDYKAEILNQLESLSRDRLEVIYNFIFAIKGNRK
jgi:transcriptional regulator with XRE-family HTH domain